MMYIIIYYYFIERQFQISGQNSLEILQCILLDSDPVYDLALLPSHLHSFYYTTM